MRLDDAKKINRLDALGFNGLVIAWKAWKEKYTIKDEYTIKDDRGGPTKNSLMLKLVSL